MLILLYALPEPLAGNEKEIGVGQAQTVKATAGAAPVKQSVSSAKAPSAPAANGQTQPKKKNRKRVQERLAAQEAAKNAENGSSEKTDN